MADLLGMDEKDDKKSKKLGNLDKVYAEMKQKNKKLKKEIATQKE